MYNYKATLLSKRPVYETVIDKFSSVRAWINSMSGECTPRRGVHVVIQEWMDSERRLEVGMEQAVKRQQRE